MQKSIAEFTVCLWLQLLEPDYFEILYQAADDNEAIGVTLTLGREITLKMFGKTRYDYFEFVSGSVVNSSYADVGFYVSCLGISQDCRCVGTGRAVASRVHNMDEEWGVRSHEGWESGRTRERTCSWTKSEYSR